eukprot:CAMPEP_0196805444 /NCGR_PEP_ID=MMETSP1362-20130617/5207_1 /TAXON_ID=163516 /ORGANISM="Leptocylindrus danicus, Strain CCMP1856" /LENGTH=551 /DNA_ID=CAMNT_0042178359 /DNA_START=79 /DNA_END=1731 /DNA_ORIENTATION=+
MSESKEASLEDEFSQEDIDEIVSDFQSQVNGLGAHPDKVKINTISMIADDYQTIPTISKQLYGCMRAILVDQHREENPDIKLPLVYLLDSILKNVGGIFIDLAAKDAGIWMRKVFETVKDVDKSRLRRVHGTWRDAALFSEDKLKQMARCFVEADARTKQAAHEAVARKQNTERQRTAAVVDAALSQSLQSQMLVLLEDLKRDMPDAAGLTLDGLAEMNPSLYENLKATATDMMHGNTTNLDDSSQDHDPLIFLLKSEEEMERAKEWESVGFGILDSAAGPAHQDVQKWIDNLQRHVRIGSQTIAAEPDYDNIGDADVVKSILISSSVSAKYLTGMVEHYESVSRDSDKAVIQPMRGLLMRQDSQSLRNVDTSLFTTEGIKEKNAWVIGSLYDDGLPHVSKADGRRFATEIQLSKHLDYIFKKSQIEKSMERTEERGYYNTLDDWIGGKKDVVMTEVKISADTRNKGDDNAKVSAAQSLPEVPADENRSNCLICGKTFDIYYNDDEEEYMYRDAIEIEVLNDEAALEESEQILVHCTCHRRLGAPKLLTAD